MKSRKPDGLVILTVIFVLGLMVGAVSFHSGQAEAGVASVSAMSKSTGYYSP